jgi:hypothetical protein
MRKKSVSAFLLYLLLLALVLAPMSPSLAATATPTASEVEIGPIVNAASLNAVYYPLFVPGDAVSATPTTVGTPFAIYVTAQGQDPNSLYNIRCRLGPTLAQYHHWTGVNWGVGESSYVTSFPFTTDAGGNWSGWLVNKVYISTAGTPTDSVGLQPRMRKAGSSTNIYPSTITINRMTMTATGYGGWVEGHAYQNGQPLANQIVVVKNASDQIVGTYITENNNVVEGYTSTDTGYYKVAVPAGTGFAVELWDRQTNALMGRQTGVDVTAGAVTPNIDLTAGNPPTLTWTGEPGYIADGLDPETGTPSTTFTYRVKYVHPDNTPPATNNPKVCIFKDASEIAGSPFPLTYVSGTPTPGEIYSYACTLPAGNYSYRFTATDSVGLVAVGAATALMIGPVVYGDSTAPTLFNLHPARYSSTYNLTPTISFQYQDSDSGVDLTSVQLVLDGLDLTAASTQTSSQLTFVPTIDLSFGTHTATAYARDLAGNGSTLSWTFTIITSLASPEHYLGDIHSHTSYSDGAGLPSDAYTYARDTANIDFLAITDHSNSLTTTEWDDERTQADTFNATGTFVALAGFEWTHTQDGHINVYNTDTYVSRNDASYDTLAEFYGWLKVQPTAIAEFNHPFSNQEFQGFAYDPAVDAKITMQEVGNGSPPYSYARLEPTYIYALDKGWHVGATNNQDNHAANWGFPPNNLTGIVADQLSRDEVLSAMRSMRTYGTEDRDLHLSFQVNNYWMGTTIECAAGALLQFSATVSDVDDPISLLQIITSGGTVLDSQTVSATSYTWNLSYTNPGGGNWYYLKVTEADGDIAISSPIWTASADIDLRVTGFSASPLPAFPGVLTTLTAYISNYGLFPGNGLTVSFYQGTPTTGILLGTSTLTVPAGQTLSATTSWTPTTAGTQILTVVLTAPPEDPPLDNVATLNLRVVGQNGKKVLLDRYHKNDYAGTTNLGNLTEVVDLLRFNGYQVLENATAITPSSLDGIDVLIVTYPQSGSGQLDFSTDELNAVRAFVLGGKALLFAGKSNHLETPTRYNDFLTSLGVGININGDNIYDKTNTYGYDWSVNLFNFPPTPSGIADQISNVRFFSGASLIKPDKTPLVSNTASNLEVLAFANVASYDEDDVTGATHVTTGYYTYSYASHPSGATMPAMAVQTLPAGGRVAVLGRAIFSNYELGNWQEGQAACNNEAFTVNLVDWLANYNRVLSIAQARQETTPYSPDRLGQTMTVRGVVTAGSGTFFDVLYLQDATGGISVFGSIPSDKVIPLGAVLQVTGVLDQYNNDLELKFNDFYQDFLWVGWTTPVVPQTLGTGPAMLRSNEGLLVEITGIVTQILDAGSCLIDDGSGPALVFIDGYIGQLPAGLQVGDTLQAVGLTGEFAGGHRLRVRDPSELVFFHATFTLTYNAGANGTITGPTPQTVNYGLDGSAVTAVPNPGYHFLSWDDGILTATRTDTNVTADHTFTANFTTAIDSFTLTYTAGANGTITGPTPQTVNYGASGTLVTAVPNPGYHFLSWDDGVLTATRTDTNVTANIDVTANFAIDTFTTPKSSKQGVLVELIALKAKVTDKQNGKKLDEAIKHLTASLTPSWWNGDARLQVKEGEKVFNEEMDAVKELCGLIKDKKSSTNKALLLSFVDRIVEADRLLAVVAIADATGGNPKDIAKANVELGKGSADAALGNYESAIQHYLNAWKLAQDAIKPPKK